MGPSEKREGFESVCRRGDTSFQGEIKFLGLGDRKLGDILGPFLQGLNKKGYYLVVKMGSWSKKVTNSPQPPKIGRNPKGEP